MNPLRPAWALLGALLTRPLYDDSARGVTGLRAFQRFFNASFI
jgi:hypothetical protein